MSCPFIFVREASDLSLVSLDPCSIHHPIYFGCDYLPCFDAGWPSLTFLFLYFRLSLFYHFIPLFHSTSSVFFFLILLDVWLGFNIHTLHLLIWYVHSFITIFRVGTPRFGTHDVFYALHFMHEGPPHNGICENASFYNFRIMEFVRLIRTKYIGLWWGPHIHDFVINWWID